MDAYERELLGPMNMRPRRGFSWTLRIALAVMVLPFIVYGAASLVAERHYNHELSRVRADITWGCRSYGHEQPLAVCVADGMNAWRNDNPPGLNWL